MQRAMNRAAFGDIQKPGALLVGELALELHLAVNVVQLAGPRFAACAVLGVDAPMAQPHRGPALVFTARPEVLAHNIETVPRIFRRIRPAFRYTRSLEVLTRARDAGLVTKSNLILGLGEERHEVARAMRDLHDAGCELLTITQYLRPSVRHHPVERWVTPEEFAELREEALEIGFAGVMSGPLVRSSYRAGRLYREAMTRRRAGGVGDSFRGAGAAAARQSYPASF
jgi:lipoic acid synthetase